MIKRRSANYSKNANEQETFDGFKKRSPRTQFTFHIKQNTLRETLAPSTNIDDKAPLAERDCSAVLHDVVILASETASAFGV